MRPIDTGGGGSLGADGTTSLSRQQFSVAWSYTEPWPTGNLLHFEVRVFLGTDPTDDTQYLFPPQIVPPAERAWVGVLTSANAYTTVHAAVKAVYNY